MTTQRADELAEAAEIRALVAQTGSKYLAQREETAIAQREEAAQFRALLTRTGPAWLKDASAAALVAFCRVAAAVHLNPLMGEIYYLFGAVYVGVQGRRVLAARTREMQGESAPRMLTKEERATYGVRDGDVGRMIEVWRKGWRMPAVGIGIVRKGEIDAARQQVDRQSGLAFRPLGRDPEGMAAKRAAVAAYKKAFPEIDVPSADVYVAAGGEDYEVELLDAHPGVLDGEAVEADDAATPPPEESAADRPVAAAAVPVAAEAEGLGAPLEPPSPEPPPADPLPAVADVASLLAWARSAHGKLPEQVSAALGGTVAGDIAQLVQEHYGGDYGQATAALDTSWQTQGRGTRLL